jgi:hypothetical protein
VVKAKFRLSFRSLCRQKEVIVIDKLNLSMSELGREEVLVQAWKKASAHIRYHNWFADTLELDLTAINLQDFISQLSHKLKSGELIRNQPLRLVPAPKSQSWGVHNDGHWGPLNGSDASAKLRPLAHVSLQDQVITTSLMMMLANRIESAQGDPRYPNIESKNERVISYGNRLFCDPVGKELRHRWGSTKLYRGYFQDYQSFLERPEQFAEKLAGNGKRTVVLQSDIKQFYDRVSPELLHKCIRSFQVKTEEDDFFNFACSYLDWVWHKSDAAPVELYQKQASLKDFSRVSLPQGLVPAGFLQIQF